MNSLFAQGNRYPYTNTGAAINSGDVITLASGTANGYIGIAVSAIAATTGTGELCTGGYPEGVFTLVKNTGEVWTDGQPVYWDSVNKWFTNVPGTLTRGGRAFGSALSAALTATIAINR